MNPKSIGERIENTIKLIEELNDDKGGFDACLDNNPIEIKGCMKVHKNGCNPNGKDRITKGRFWIDNRAHKILLERKGFYIFVIYYMAGEMPTISKYTYKSAKAVDKLINLSENTKIRYDRIFPDYKGEAVL